MSGMKWAHTSRVLGFGCLVLLLLLPSRGEGRLDGYFVLVSQSFLVVFFLSDFLFPRFFLFHLSGLLPFLSSQKQYAGR